MGAFSWLEISQNSSLRLIFLYKENTFLLNVIIPAFLHGSVICINLISLYRHEMQRAISTLDPTDLQLSAFRELYYTFLFETATSWCCFGFPRELFRVVILPYLYFKPPLCSIRLWNISHGRYETNQQSTLKYLRISLSDIRNLKLLRKKNIYRERSCSLLYL